MNKSPNIPGQMVGVRPGHVQQHVRHQRALPAGVELLEEPRHLADDALLLVVALLAVAAIVVQGADVAVGEEVVPESKDNHEFML